MEPELRSSSLGARVCCPQLSSASPQLQIATARDLPSASNPLTVALHPLRALNDLLAFSFILHFSSMLPTNYVQRQKHSAYGKQYEKTHQGVQTAIKTSGFAAL
jgi:hypothetical protein